MTHSFWVTKPDGSIDELSATKLDLLAFYAHDEKSVHQGLKILEIEKAYHSANPQEWQFSALSMDVLNAAMKRAAQVHVCGVITLIMVHLSTEDAPVSLNEASANASEIFNNMGKATFVVPKSQGWVRQDKSIVGDMATIQRYFRKYRSCAHICAARTLIGSSGEGHPLVRPLPATLTYLSTVLHYQRVLKPRADAAGWNMVDICFEGDSFEQSYPAMKPLEAQISAIRNIKEKLKSGAVLLPRDFEIPPGET